MRNSFILPSLVLLCLTSCRGLMEDSAAQHHELSFSCSQDESKTSLDGSLKATIWDEFDTKDRFWVYENGVAGTVTGVAISDGKLVLDASFGGIQPDFASYTALYSAVGSSPEEAELPSVQHPRCGSFDPAAELLVARPLVIRGSAGVRNPCFRFARAAAVSRMTLKDLEKGDKVRTVEICTDAAISGMLDIVYVDESVLVEASSESGKVSKKLTLSYSKDNTIGDDGLFELWFTSLPARISEMDVKVTTDRYVYSISAGNLDMAWTTDRVSLLSLPLSKAKITPLVKDFTLVTDVSQLSDGDRVVIVCNSQGVIATDISGNVLGYVQATFSADKSTITSLPDDALKLTLSGSAPSWSFINDSDLKLGCTSVKNLAWSRGETLWTISNATNGQIEIKSNNSSYGKLQYNSQSPRFTTYTSSQKPVQLYRISGSSGPQEPLALVMGNVECSSRTSSSLSFSWASVKHSTGYSVNFDGVSPFTTSQTSYTAGGLKPGTSYTVSVKALGDGDLYIDSSPFTLTVSTLEEGQNPSGACRGWFEMPAQKDDDHNGIDDLNSDYYYSWTIRADAAKVRNFSSCYSKKYRHPVWVAAPLHKCYLGSSGRNDSYKPDPAISCSQSSSFSGYTRGHMVSSNERTVSKPTNRQVFYYSNIGAQMSSGFNTGGGAWNNLEDFVDNNIVCSDTLYQVVGCIFETFKDKSGGTVAKKSGDGFQVPTAWYKALLRTKKGNSGKRVDNCSADELMCVAFILPHKSDKGHKPAQSDMYSISELEELTGLTFFVNVPNAPKSSYKASDWGL